MNPGKTTGSKDDRTKIRGIVADIELPQNVKTCNSTKTVTENMCDHDHGYVPLVVITIPSFPHCCFITGCLIVTRRVPLVE
jgi:hypothetical protein